MIVSTNYNHFKLSYHIDDTLIWSRCLSPPLVLIFRYADLFSSRSSYFLLFDHITNVNLDYDLKNFKMITVWIIDDVQ